MPFLPLMGTVQLRSLFNDIIARRARTPPGSSMGTRKLVRDHLGRRRASSAAMRAAGHYVMALPCGGVVQLYGVTGDCAGGPSGGATTSI